MMALDMKLIEYNVTDAQLKRAIFEISELETVDEAISVTNSEMGTN